MDQFISIEISGFGARLRQERERLGLTLHDFGLLGEVNRMTQGRYETGASSPSLEYLYRIGQHGVNTMFVTTGLDSSKLVWLQDPIALSQAIDVIDEIARQHNFTPPPEFRIRAVLQVYRQILKFGAKEVHPTLEDLLNAVQAT